MTSQIALPLIPAGAGEPSSIVIGSGNRAVAEALAAPASWPFRTAILHGPPRAGKSLFARWFAAQQAGEAIDDAETLDETAIFHRWNRAQESGIPLLLVVGGGGWDIALPDLRSRMGAALQLEIGPPGMERSYAAIEKIVGEIDRLSLERQVPATLSVWRDALEAVQGPDQGRLL